MIESATSTPIQVLHVLGRMVRGGAECWLMDLWRRMDRRRFHFTFCTLRAEPGVFDEEIRSLGGSIVPCPLDVGRRTFARNFLNLLDEAHFHVIHSHVLLFSGYILRLAARAGIPLRIAHAHTTQDSPKNSIRRQCYRGLMRHGIRRHCTQGIACSESAARFLFGERWPLTGKYFVSPCTIDPAAFGGTGHRQGLRAAFGIPADAKVLGHVGGFRWQKNHSFLVRVAAEVMSRDQRVWLVLVGDGPLRGDVEAAATSLGIVDRVTFTGVRDDVPRLMSDLFDLYLFPSKLEGLPVSLIEAQCAGRYCLTSDAVTREAVVVDELVSFELLNAEPAIWADRALELLARPTFDKDRAMRMIQESRFNIATSVAFLSDLYSSGRNQGRQEHWSGASQSHV